MWQLPDHAIVDDEATTILQRLAESHGLYSTSGLRDGVDWEQHDPGVEMIRTEADEIEPATLMVSCQVNVEAALERAAHETASAVLLAMSASIAVRVHFVRPPTVVVFPDHEDPLRTRPYVLWQGAFETLGGRLHVPELGPGT